MSYVNRGLACLVKPGWPFQLLDKTRQDKDKTRQDKTKTRHDTTRYDKTRQDKTRQGKDNDKEKPVVDFPMLSPELHLRLIDYDGSM